jgi:DNA-binding protein YbaB
MSVYDRQLEDLTAGYLAQLKKADELRRKISEIAVSVTAPRQVAKVTVGAQGEVRALEFPTSVYKRMAPAELATALMASIDEAREKAQAEYAELMNPHMPGGLNVIDLMKGNVDFAATLPAELPVPDAVIDYLANGRPRQIGDRNG